MSYTIKTLADLFQVTPNKIRFYEKKELLHPQRNLENSYRIYDQSDVLHLQRILLYRSLGMSINQIKSIFQSDSDKSTLDQFNQLWEMTNLELHRLTGIQQTLEQVLDLLYENAAESQAERIGALIKNNQATFQARIQWKDQWDFNDWASHYDASINHLKQQAGIYQSYDKLLDTVVTFCESNQVHPLNILDIGIGTGNLAKRLLESGAEVTGVDQSRKMIAVAKRKLPHIKMRLGDFMNLPFENNRFDAIATTYAFHHLNEKEKEIALDEMLRVLKPEGFIVIGDMMFESDAAKEKLMSAMTQHQIDEVNDEYYSNIEHLAGFASGRGLTLTQVQVDAICWIVKIEKT